MTYVLLVLFLTDALYPIEIKGDSLIFLHVHVRSCSMLFFFTMFVTGVKKSFASYKPGKRKANQVLAWAFEVLL